MSLCKLTLAVAGLAEHGQGGGPQRPAGGFQIAPSASHGNRGHGRTRDCASGLGRRAWLRACWNPLRRPVGSLALAFTVVACSFLLAGCQQGLRWRLGRYEDASADAKAQHKLLFVYFRNWYLVECTTFEEQVLAKPSVVAATAPMICVPLEFDVSVDRRLAWGWGIRQAPAFAIVDPAGHVLERGSNPITEESLLAAIERANARFGATTAPAGKP
jgi:hypothetical protein